MGGGTGSNLEYLGDRIQRLKKLYVVDLSPSLLEVARQRIDQRGWHNAQIAEADATTFCPAEGYADVVTFSYSLTMIPDWFAAIDNALRMLRPGGQIGVVDFYVLRKYPADQHVRAPVVHTQLLARLVQQRQRVSLGRSSPLPWSAISRLGVSVSRWRKYRTCR